MAEDANIQMTRPARVAMATEILTRLDAFSVEVASAVGEDGVSRLAEIKTLYSRLTGNDGLTALAANEPNLTRSGVQSGVYYLEAIVQAWHADYDGIITAEQRAEAYSIHNDGYKVFVSGGYQTNSGGGGK